MVVTELMRDGEANAAMLPGVVVIDDVPFRALSVRTEHSLEPRKLATHDPPDRVCVVAGDFSHQGFDVDRKAVFARNVPEHTQEPICLLLGRFPLYVGDQSLSKASRISCRGSFSGAAIF